MARRYSSSRSRHGNHGFSDDFGRVDWPLHGDSRNDSGLVGICFAIHGITNGTQVQESFLDLGDLDLKALFAKYGVPILLENEANLSAIYSRDFVEELGLENTVTLSIHQGIAAGFILENKLYRGSQGRVGNLGHNIVMPAFSINNSRSQVTYQDVYSEYAVIHQISDLLGKADMSLDEISKLYADHNAEVITVLSSLPMASLYSEQCGGMLDPDVSYLTRHSYTRCPVLSLRSATTLSGYRATIFR